MTWGRSTGWRGRAPAASATRARGVAWLRRHPDGGWTLDLERHGRRQQQMCATLADAALQVARRPDVDHLHLWSEGEDDFVELTRESLVPLLRASLVGPTWLPQPPTAPEEQ